GQEVAGAVERAPEGVGDEAEGVVAAHVAVALVVGVEVIDVRHDEREGTAVAGRPAPLGEEDLVELAAVGDAGQGVDRGEALEGLVGALELAGHLDELALAGLAGGDLAAELEGGAHPGEEVDDLEGLGQVVEGAGGEDAV